MKLEQLKAALREYGVQPFRDESSYPISQAQRNLAGRTHYCDADTIKYFGARINACHCDFNGLYLYLLESVAHPTAGRVHRAVVFDVFGTVLTQGSEALRKTAKQARKDLDAFMGTFDALAHTEAALRHRIERDQDRLVRAARLLNEGV